MNGEKSTILGSCATCGEFSVPWDWLGQAMMQEHIRERHPIVHRLGGSDPKLVSHSTLLGVPPRDLTELMSVPLNLDGLL